MPPDDFSPLVESLLPQQILLIEPCFYFGNLDKRVLAGPLFIEDDTAFVPVPEDTSLVSEAILSELDEDHARDHFDLVGSLNNEHKINHIKRE